MAVLMLGPQFLLVQQLLVTMVSRRNKQKPIT